MVYQLDLYWRMFYQLDLYWISSPNHDFYWKIHWMRTQKNISSVQNQTILVVKLNETHGFGDPLGNLHRKEVGQTSAIQLVGVAPLVSDSHTVGLGLRANQKRKSTM